MTKKEMCIEIEVNVYSVIRRKRILKLLHLGLSKLDINKEVNGHEIEAINKLFKKKKIKIKRCR